MIGLSPLERPDPGLVAALCEAGALGVLDLGRDVDAARRALDALRVRGVRAFGVRVPEGAQVREADLPPAATTVIVGEAIDAARFVGRRVIAQVTSIEEAREALGLGAHGVIAKGHEAGGRVGEETTFVLVQRLVAELACPVWAQGGIGERAAAACIAGGAAGVVLDTQLALVRESSLSAAVQAAIGAMDGSETVLVAGTRVFTRPDLPKATGLGAGELRARLGGDDLAAQFLPVGQDGAFARALATQYPSAAQLVRGIAASIDRQIQLAADVQPLAPGSAFAQSHGLRYPIAQGPMSRVSDRAKFAAAVADAGALPFLALTLMSGPEVRELLRETQALAGDRPWGVGILGFVPEAVREQQLAVLAEIPPPVALIAGGRPSQAHPLEAQGTATYLHVPSPGLLDLFLKDGARRFVFEGRECGGHVGPRSSFALWEQMLARLAAVPDVGDLHVLFAGGIHDARSAAMVAAMAAPLAARGAKVGVLMGTAYLFTDEAVAAGAIQAGFQEAALACDRTVLLETAPGHATRCADTEFAAAFAREKSRLEATGASPQDVWAALEQLNLGRLRIAAKGLRRDGDAIGEVAADVQAREGMFMIGQVAALRRSTCTVLDLHRAVSRGGAEFLTAAADARAAAADAALEGDASRRGTDVALIGVAAIMPGAPDTDAFWANIVGGKNAIREVPPERWSAEVYYDPAATGEGAGKKTPCKWGGFLDDVPFEPLAYGIPPKSLTAIEPVQLLALEIARRALVDAGYGERSFDRERTAVIFGAEAGTDLSTAYSFRAMFPHYVGPLPAGLDAQLPTLSEDSFPGVLSNVIAGRIANRLDLGGVNYTVDAACAASLAAVDMAVKELVSGSSDMVLCGGADLHNSINDYLMFASVHALSPTGQCHTFDAKADGIVLGEGVACVVLKRLADAERDGDRIYAVIKGVAGASDGKSLGLTAPRKDGQVRALERAYRQAGVSPSEVGLVEAHGTGTIVGDRTELATLTEVYTKAGAAAGACVLGSVKSQIGHTKCAAGMAGLIKTALAIHHGVLPPTSNIVAPNPAWEGSSSPFVFLDRARPWIAEQRTAAVSAFGFGGTNFHAVLTSHDPARGEAAASEWPAELFLIRGADRASAIAACERLGRAIGATARLRDLARSVCAAGGGDVQIAIVAESLADLRAKLAAIVAGTVAPTEKGIAVRGAVVEGKVAFLCPGQGSQRTGMLADLFVAFPRVRRWLELGAAWAPLVYPAQAFSREEKAAQAAALTDTRVAQPALGMVDLAVAELLQTLGVRPDLAGGHSYGELAALSVGGALGDADLLALSAARGEAILAAAGADPGTMLAVAADASVVAPIIAGCEGVVIANHNSPSQCVLSGATVAIEMASVLVSGAGLTARKIPVACAFHSPIVAGAKDALAKKLAELDVRAPKIPVWSNVTGEPHGSDPAAVRAALADQVAQPVRFAQEIESMYAAGARIFVETGPGQVLTRLTAEILGARPHVAIACDTGGEAGGLRQLLRALGGLAVAGVAVDAAPLFADRDAALVELDPERAAARRGKPAMTWLVNGHVARPANGPAPQPVKVEPLPMISAGVPSMAPAANATGGERDGVIVEYLRTMRSMIAAQRDVMLAYFGAQPAPMVEVAPVMMVAPVVAPAPRVIDVPPAPVAAPAPAAIDPLELVVSIVSERTGYPVETLGVDLDLEADLSIDSIKRIEIIGDLAQRLGLRVQGAGKEADAIVEELARRKTLRALIDWLTARLANDAVPSSVEDAVTAPMGRAGANGSAHSPTTLPLGISAASPSSGSSHPNPSRANVSSAAVSAPAPTTSANLPPAIIFGSTIPGAASSNHAATNSPHHPGATSPTPATTTSPHPAATTSATPAATTSPHHAAATSSTHNTANSPHPPATTSSTPATTTSPTPAATTSSTPAATTSSTPAATTSSHPAATTSPHPSTATNSSHHRGATSATPATTTSPHPAATTSATAAAATSPNLPAGISATAAAATSPNLPAGISASASVANSYFGPRSATHSPEAPLAAGTGTYPAAPAVECRAPARYRLDVVAAPLPANGHSSFAGQRFAIHADASRAALATELASRLAAEGARVHLVGDADRATDVDGFIELAPAATIADLRARFERVRDAMTSGARTLLVATAHGDLGRGGAGGLPGAAGLAKTVAAEYPSARVRAVDLDPRDLASAGERLHAELHAADPHAEVGYVDGARVRFEVVSAPAPAGAALALTADSVVLVTGGARGITAQAAVALVARTGCRLELVGRSPLPGPEDPAIAPALDAPSLRRAFASQTKVPAEIERRTARALADREVRGVLAQLAALNARFTYHALDVREPAFGALIDDIYARCGRLDGVIHGAGVLEDKLIRDKTGESYERVVATKLAAAQVLVEKLRPGAAFVAFFSSISGAFGNRGQVDYATAGDALDKLAHARADLAARVVSLDWGPWAGTGMVSPELAREYARRGIALIEPRAGIDAMLAELASGARDAQVVLTAAEPRALVRPGAGHERPAAGQPPAATDER